MTEASTQFPPVRVRTAPGMGIPNQVSASFRLYPFLQASEDTGVGL